MDLISIIVPVYNVADYLCECVDSICSQTYRNLEIILVDDGSDDNCPKLCDEYALKDSRIRVIHQSNQGLSAARNAGYRESNGKYIAFIDSDDKISNIFIENLYELLLENDAQIAACAYTRRLDQLAVGKGLANHVLTSGEMLRGWHGKYKRIETVVWNKLYDRQILEAFSQGELFPKGRTHEDVYVSHLLIRYARTVVITKQKLYFYRRRNDSISKIASRKTAEEDLEAQKARLDFFQKNKFLAAYLRLYIGHLLHRVKYVKERLKIR